MIELVVLFFVVLLLSFVVYYVAQLTTKETPYEEAIAVQKKNQNFNILSSKNEQVQRKKTLAKRTKLNKEDTGSRSISKIHKTSSADKLNPVVISNGLTQLKNEKIDTCKAPASQYLVNHTAASVHFFNGSTDKTSQNHFNLYNNMYSQKCDGKEFQEHVLRENIPKCSENINKCTEGNTNKKLKIDPVDINGKSENVKKAHKIEKECEIFDGNRENNEKDDIIENKVKEAKIIDVKFKKNKKYTDQRADNNETKVKKKIKKDFCRMQKEDEANNSSSSTDQKRNEIKVNVKNHNSKTCKYNRALETNKGQDVAGNGKTESRLTIKDQNPQTVQNSENKSVNKPVIEKTYQTSNKEMKKERTEIQAGVETRKKLRDDAPSNLLSIVQRSNLSGIEIQMIIEALLNKQSSGNIGGEWVEKGKLINPISQLKRQVEESEAREHEQMETNVALSAKISELRLELNSEKVRNNSLKKQLDRSSSILQQKLDAAAAIHQEQILAKLNETKVALKKEYHTSLIQQQQTISRENEMQLQNFQTLIVDLEKQLQQSKLSHQETEIKYEQVKNVLSDVQLQLKTFTHERDELVQTCQKYQQHLTSLKDQVDQQEVEFNSRLYETQQKFNLSEASNKKLMLQLQHSSSEKDLLDQQLRNLINIREILSQNQVKLKNTVDEKMDLENQLINSERESNNLKELINDQRLEIDRQKKEYESLASKILRPTVDDLENDTNYESTENSNYNKIKTSLNTFNKMSKWKEELPASWMESKDNEELPKQSPSPQEKTKIVEKIIEKVVQDPHILKQLEELKENNVYLEIKVKSLMEEKSLLENNLKATSLEDQDRLIQDLQLENKNLTEKIANYQCILSNTESLLKTLQKSVEIEESTWQEKLLEKEEVLNQLLVDKSNLTAKVSELTSSLHKIRNAEEVELELNRAREKLLTEEENNHKLEKELQKTRQQLETFHSIQNGGRSELELK